MSNDASPERTRALSARQIQDLFALAFLVIGAALVLVAAFMWDTRVGIAALGVVLTGAGIVLGMQRL